MPALLSATARRLALSLLLVPAAAMAEEPAYTTIADFDAGVEIREYAPMLVAEYAVEGGDFAAASSAAFRPLADFIFGDNTHRERIGMTAPVTQRRDGETIGMTAPVVQSAREGRWVVGFVMPARYTAETLPVPRNPRIRIVEVPARTVAAIRFSGRWSTVRHAENLRLLQSEIAEAGWEPAGEPQAAQYDAPWVPGPLRRNEVLLPVRRRE